MMAVCKLASTLATFVVNPQQQLTTGELEEQILVLIQTTSSPQQIESVLVYCPTIPVIIFGGTSPFMLTRTLSMWTDIKPDAAHPKGSAYFRFVFGSVYRRTGGKVCYL